jgi:hypothetical protein
MSAQILGIKRERREENMGENVMISSKTVFAEYIEE